MMVGVGDSLQLGVGEVVHWRFWWSCNAFLWGPHCPHAEMSLVSAGMVQFVQSWAVELSGVGLLAAPFVAGVGRDCQ